MINTGTNEKTTLASAISVDSKRPNPELMKAHSYNERVDRKKTPAVLFKWLGNQAITMNKKTVKIYIG